MSNLLYQLRSRQSELHKVAEFEKTAEEIFEAAFFDELEKLGYDVEMLKEAGILGDAAKWGIGKIKSLLPGAKKMSRFQAATQANAAKAARVRKRMKMVQQAGKDWGKTRGPQGWVG